MKKEAYLLLHNIRSAHNVGSIFRTADAAGVMKIYISGYTPRPVDQFGRVNKEIAKTALGGEKNIAWEQARTASQVINKLRKEGVVCLALEQSPDSIDYKKYRPTSNFLLVLGNEVDGVETKLLKSCDEIIEIPMKGDKESLNVGVATGIALFRLLGI